MRRKRNSTSGKSYIYLIDKLYSNFLTKYYFILDTYDVYFLIHLSKNGINYKVKKIFQKEDFLAVFIIIWSKKDKKFREVMDNAYRDFLLTHDKSTIDQYNEYMFKFS